MNMGITTDDSDEDLTKQNGELTSQVFNGNSSILTSRNETLQSCNANGCSKNLETSHFVPRLFGNTEAAKSFDILKSDVRLKKCKNKEQLDNNLKNDDHGFHKTKQHNYHSSKAKELIKTQSYEAVNISAQNEEYTYFKHNKNEAENLELTNKTCSLSSEKTFVKQLDRCTNETKKKFDTFSHRHQPRSSVFPLNSNQKYHQKSYSDGYLDSSLDQRLKKYEREGVRNSTTETIDTTTQTEKVPEEKNNAKKPSKRPCRTESWLAFTTTFIMLAVALLAASVLITKIYKKRYKHLKGEPAEPNEKTSAFYKRAAVVTATPVCSKVGADILRMNGSAVDAAIASCLCVGVINKHSSGIGGGGFMLIYQREKIVKDLRNRFTALDFREEAPGRSKWNMLEYYPNRTGGLTIGVPGEVKGLYYAYRKFGRLPWKHLVEPSIYLAKNGFHMSARLSAITRIKKNSLQEDIGLRRLMLQSNSEPKPPGYMIKDELLAKTLETIRDRPLSFYRGNLAERIVQDIQKAGGIVTLDDLANYKVKLRRVLRDKIDNFKFFTCGAPAGGAVIAQIINILKSYRIRRDDIDSPNLDRVALTYHRIIEAMKIAFAKRTAEGDPDFTDKNEMYKLMDSMVNETEGEYLRRLIDDTTTHEISYYRPLTQPNYEMGTSHINVLAENGDAVALTTSINQWKQLKLKANVADDSSRFGANYRSTDTGIIYNNQMMDFNSRIKINAPNSPLATANFIHAGKRPLASMSPIIMTSYNENVRFVIGGAGGRKIIPATTLVIINKLWLHDTLEHAINRKRFYHTLFPNRVKAEETDIRDKELIRLLQAKNHFVVARDTVDNSEVLGIFVTKKGEIHAGTDIRRHSHSDGY